MGNIDVFPVFGEDVANRNTLDKKISHRKFNFKFIYESGLGRVFISVTFRVPHHQNVFFDVLSWESCQVGFGRVGLGRVGLGQIGSYRVGSGRVGSGRSWRYRNVAVISVCVKNISICQFRRIICCAVALPTAKLRRNASRRPGEAGWRKHHSIVSIFALSSRTYEQARLNHNVCAELTQL